MILPKESHGLDTDSQDLLEEFEEVATCGENGSSNCIRIFKRREGKRQVFLTTYRWDLFFPSWSWLLLCCSIIENIFLFFFEIFDYWKRTYFWVPEWMGTISLGSEGTRENKLAKMVCWLRSRFTKKLICTFC